MAYARTTRFLRLRQVNSHRILPLGDIEPTVITLSLDVDEGCMLTCECPIDISCSISVQPINAVHPKGCYRTKTHASASSRSTFVTGTDMLDSM